MVFMKYVFISCVFYNVELLIKDNGRDIVWLLSRGGVKALIKVILKQQVAWIADVVVCFQLGLVVPVPRRNVSLAVITIHNILPVYIIFSQLVP